MQDYFITLIFCLIPDVSNVSFSFKVIFYSDYHLVHPFLEACKDEVAATSCGLIFSDKPQDTQGGDKENNVSCRSRGEMYNVSKMCQLCS